MTIRQRIEQRITDLRVERDVAAAAQEYLSVQGNTWGYIADRVIGPAHSTHIATQDPATVIARIDRELAGCAADLALLDWATSTASGGGAVVVHPEGSFEALTNLEARYPSEESS